MVAGITLHDRNAWDDSALIDSWDEALAEYQKYYSISAQGRRLEDVLSEEELKQLKEEHGHLIEEPETKSSATATNNHADQAPSDIADKEHAAQFTAQPEEPAASEQQNQPRTQEVPEMPAMAQPILDTVQDENLKNVLMSWYYAGYYTGLYAGGQKKS